MAPTFRFVCSAGALAETPKGWAAETLRDGELALTPDAGGLEAINAAAHALGQITVAIMRGEDTETAQEQTVIAFAGPLPLVWLAERFSDAARAWAHDRGPMTLLAETDGALPAPQRARISRFLAVLARQSE